MNYKEDTDELEPIKVEYKELDESYEYFNFFDMWSNVAVWEFHNAPRWAKKLSINGGDEDWLAVCTKEFWEKRNGYIRWLDCMGYGDLDIFEVDGKFMVFIGSHA